MESTAALLGVGNLVLATPLHLHRRMRNVLCRHLLANQALLESSKASRSPVRVILSGSDDIVSPVARSTFSSDRTPADTHSSPSRQHWLDRRFPGLREWLDAKNRRWWLKGLQAWYRWEKVENWSCCGVVTLHPPLVS